MRAPLFAAFVLSLAPSCAPAHEATSAHESANPEEPSVMNSSPNEGVSNLPFAQGKSFATLDAYLAHRRALGAIDAPYYEEISPGRYRLTVGLRDPLQAPPAPQYFTREQLLRQFGFRE